MTNAPSRRRRQLLAFALGSAFAPLLQSQPQVLGVWVSGGSFPFWDKQLGMAFAPNSQVAVEAAHAYFVPIGNTVVPMASHSRQGRQAVRQPFLENMRVDADFRALLAREPAVEMEGFSLVTADSEEAAAIRIWPSVLLHMTGEVDARVSMVCMVEAVVPGIRKFRWSCTVETTTVVPINAPGGVDDPSQALRRVVHEQAPHVLFAAAREARLRLRKEWADPADPEKLVHINMPWWPSNVFYSYLVVAETDTLLFLAQANRGLGHLFDRRYIWDKRLIAATQRP